MAYRIVNVPGPGFVTEKPEITKYESFRLFLKGFPQKYPEITFLFLGMLIIVPFLIYDFTFGMPLKELIEGLTTSIIEVFFLGIVVIGYNKLSERKSNIKRYLDEIDFFRDWREPEAAHRIAGLIRLLNENKVKEFNLEGCFLSGADLREADLVGIHMLNINLKKADLMFANLCNANLGNANLRKTKAENSTFNGAILSSAKLKKANLSSAYLNRAKLTGAKLTGAILSYAHLENADLSCVDFKNANLNNTNLKGADIRKAKFCKTILDDINLKDAQVDSINWIEKLKDNKCSGWEVIAEKYTIEVINGKYEYDYVLRLRNTQ